MRFRIDDHIKIKCTLKDVRITSEGMRPFTLAFATGELKGRVCEAKIVNEEDK